MKTIQLLIATVLGIVCANLYAQVEIPDNQTIKMGNKNVAVYISNTGKYGQAAGIDIDPGNSLEGIIIENGTSESAGFYADGDYAVIWSPGDQQRLLRLYDEDLMGGSTYERAYFDSNGNLYTVSDMNQKRDISQITDAISKLKGMKGVAYFYVNPENEEKSTEDKAIAIASEKKYVGLLAQDVEQVIPEAVDTDGFGNKFINYSAIIPVLVEVCKSQQEMLDTQENQLKTQEEAVQALNDELQQLKEIVAQLQAAGQN